MSLEGDGPCAAAKGYGTTCALTRGRRNDGAGGGECDAGGAAARHRRSQGCGSKVQKQASADSLAVIMSMLKKAVAQQLVSAGDVKRLSLLQVRLRSR